jgi:hypothetical protein
MIPRAYRPLARDVAGEPLAAAPLTRRDADHEHALARFERFLVASHRSANTRRLYLAAARRRLEAGGVPGHFRPRQDVLGFRRRRRSRCGG